MNRVNFTEFLVVNFFRPTSWDPGTHGGEIGVAVRRELLYYLLDHRRADLAWNRYTMTWPRQRPFHSLDQVCTPRVFGFFGCLILLMPDRRCGKVREDHRQNA